MEYNQQEDCYEIKGVIGPDEYKEDVDNNYFTNALAKRHLEYRADVLKKQGMFQLWHSGTSP